MVVMVVNGNIDLEGSEEIERAFSWVAVKELKLSYQKSDTILFTSYPYDDGSQN